MKTLLLTLLFVMTVAFSPAVVSAQNMQDGTTNFETGTGTTGTTDDTNTGFDWRWLLPLLAVPLLYFAFRRNDDEQRNEEYRDQRSILGTKGGRSNRTQDDTKEETL